MKTGFFPDLPPGVYAIAGLSKNSGKTSLLNYLLQSQADRHIGVLTTGRDGEEKDALYGNRKPSVRLIPGTLFTASSEVLEQLGSSVIVLEKLPYLAGNRQLWLLKALRNLETEITGPPSAENQASVAAIMQSHGSETIFIDGSLDRKSIALHPSVNGVCLVAGGTYGSVEKIICELDRLVSLSQLHRARPLPASVTGFISLYEPGKWISAGFTSLLGNEKRLAETLAGGQAVKLFLPGALTDHQFQILRPFLSGLKEIILHHPLNLHLVQPHLEQLFHACRVSCLQPFNIAAIALNSWSVNGSHLDSNRLRTTVRKRIPDLPVIDVCEG